VTHIDYISASFNVTLQDPAVSIRQQGFDVTFQSVIPSALLGVDEKRFKRVHHKSYRDGLQSPSGVTVFFGGQDTFVVEISGRGCEQIDCIAYLDHLLNSPSVGSFQFNKITRIDIATDYLTDAMPFDLVATFGIKPRIKSRNIANSVTGQTFYVGSRHSDRFCKVYRYFRPHPRHETCRVEFQWNKKVATSVAEALVSGASALEVFAGAAHATFDNFPTGDGVEGVKVGRNNERVRANSLVWVYNQVVPALARLIDEGELSLEDLYTMIDEKRKSL
jgi:DNA relaxase NicK